MSVGSDIGGSHNPGFVVNARRRPQPDSWLDLFALWLYLVPPQQSIGGQTPQIRCLLQPINIAGNREGLRLVAHVPETALEQLCRICPGRRTYHEQIKACS